MTQQSLIRLVALCAVALSLSCDSQLDPQLDSELVPASPRALGLMAARTTGSIVFEDTVEWDTWDIRYPAQIWNQRDRGIKWITFDPNPNLASTPEFDGVKEFNVSFDIYFPDRFPLYGTSEQEPGVLLGVSAFPPATLSDESRESHLVIDLHEGRTWRIHAFGYDPQTGFRWDSGDQYMIPWAFKHGWNTIDWTIHILPGLGNDTMRLSVGDRIFYWGDTDIAGIPDPFTFFRLGTWEVRRGDRHFALSGLEIKDLAMSAPDNDPPDDPGDDPPNDPGDDPPSDPGDEPTHDPPPPPPPPGGGSNPPPPTSGDIAAGGHIIRGGFWDGWRARTHGSACEGSPCIRFHDRDGHGAFRSASQAIRFIGDDDDGQGRVTYDILFDSGQLNTGAGGKHLFNITSRPLSFTPTEVGLDDWTRIDFNQPGRGTIRATIFNTRNGEALNGGVWPSHTFAVPFDVGTWADVDIRWQQANDRLTLVINGHGHTFDLLEGSPNVGNYIAFGNIYNVDGQIEVANVTWSQ